MTARRSSADPVSAFLETGERIVWRHRPSPRTLFFNRAPQFVISLMLIGFLGWILWQFLRDALLGAASAQALGIWLVVPFAFLLFGVAIMVAFLSFGWHALGALLDSWSTHYALTDRRFMIVSDRGLIEYGPAYFANMAPLAGRTDAQVLLFDWGPVRKSRRDSFRNSIAALPDSKKLERLIRDTLKPPAPPSQ